MPGLTMWCVWVASSSWLPAGGRPWRLIRRFKFIAPNGAGEYAGRAPGFTWLRRVARTS